MKHVLAIIVLSVMLSSTHAQSTLEADIPTPQWRPVYHFTPEKNWTNDPNGLIWLDGKYLVYNQQNPFGNKWGHMSWGHATSKDLLHWKHLPVAIPEIIDSATHDTLWIFSGSAVWDEHNTSGFCTHGGCLVAIYTGHQPNLHKESQWIAYSNDGGRSYTNYDKDPVIDLHKQDFRDPNVFWYAPGNKWVMTVSLPMERKVRFYSSPNLREWSLLSEFGPQGYTGAWWECPSLMQFTVVTPIGHTSAVKGTRWVLMNSAAGGPRGVYMQYFTGNFDGKTFTNDNDSAQTLTVDEGDCFYAAIPFNNVPAAKGSKEGESSKKILVGWMIPGPQKTYPWTGQFSIPRDLALEHTPQGYRLLQTPSSVLDPALPKPTKPANIILTGNDTLQPIAAATRANNAFWLDAELEIGPTTTTATAPAAGFSIARNGAGTVETIIGYDAQKQELYIDRSRSSSTGPKPDKARQSIKIPANNGRMRLRILFDHSSLEVFTGDGEHVITDYVYPDPGATGCAVFSHGGGTASFKNLTVRDFASF